MSIMEKLNESTAAIRVKIGSFEPEALLILGSGLGYLGDECADAVEVEYADIPYFRRSTAPGHEGKLIFGMLAGRRVCVMQGRFHCYEGYSLQDVAYPVRTARMLGAKTLLVTNAAGGVNTGFKAGDMMLITDHIKMFAGSPLEGANEIELGPRFPDMTAYTASLQEKARAAASELRLPIREGVYMYFPGPQYETPAEIRAARAFGADAVGMSTVPEVIAARHCGMDVVGFSLITNMAAGILNQPLSESEVLFAANAARPQFSALALATLQKL